MTHSPIPWKIKIIRDDYTVSDSSNETIIENEAYNEIVPSYEDAEFIVKSVNSHDELVAALQRSLSWLASYPGGGGVVGPYEQAKAALAKVGAL